LLVELLELLELLLLLELSNLVLNRRLVGRLVLPLPNAAGQNFCVCTLRTPLTRKAELKRAAY